VILVLVAGNVPATLQIAARFPLRPVTKPSPAITAAPQSVGLPRIN